MGMVHAYQKGTLKNPSKEVTDAAESMDEGDVKHFAATKHEGLPQKVAWTPLLKAIGTGAGQAGITAGYIGAGHGFNLGNRWVDSHYLKDNGIPEPHVSGQVPQLPSQMNFAERSNASMAPTTRAAAEGLDVGKTMLNTDFNSFLASNPSSAKLLAPFVAGMNLLHGASPGDAIKSTATALAPGAASGLAIKALAPRWTPMGIGGTLRSGLGAGIAIKGTEYLQRATGLEAPTDLISKMNEAPWRVGTRAASNMVAGGAGGLIATKNPIGGVGGIITGAMKEPETIYQTVQEANAVADRQGDANHAARMQLIADPRHPLDKVEGLNEMPSALRDQALEARRQSALSGDFNNSRVTPRSTWKDMNTPEYMADAPGQSPSQAVDQEINQASLKASPGVEKLKRNINLDPHLAIGGGLLAGGLGIWGLRKLFAKKEEEDKSKRPGYASPVISSPDRWVTA